MPAAIENAPATDISYSQAQQNSSHYKNAPVRWGGVVFSIENKQQYSLAQVLLYPLNSNGRPNLDKPGQGLFMLKSAELLDPAVYTKGSELTVAGTLVGNAELSIDNKTLQLPMVSANALYHWPNYARNSSYGLGDFRYGYYPYYGYTGYYPYHWGSGRYWPHP
jgi:outer membrane lipoprotein